MPLDPNFLLRLVEAAYEEAGRTINGKGLNIPPTGAIMAFAGSSAPGGWLLCFGQDVSRTIFANLFDVIGTTYGVGDGSATFGLPDMRGRTAVGLDNMGGPSADRLTDAAADSLGGSGGDEDYALGNHTHTMGTHVHDLTPGHAKSEKTTGGAEYVLEKSVTAWTSTERNTGLTHGVSAVSRSVGVELGGDTAAVDPGDTNAGGADTINVDQPWKALNYLIKI